MGRWRKVRKLGRKYSSNRINGLSCGNLGAAQIWPIVRSAAAAYLPPVRDNATQVPETRVAPWTGQIWPGRGAGHVPVGCHAGIMSRADLTESRAGGKGRSLGRCAVVA